MLNSTHRHLRIAILSVLVLSWTTVASATTWNINFGGFGGSGSLAYSPKTVTVSVGDTVVWNGEFGNHPLAIRSFPAGAATFATVQSGTSFAYVVTVAGSYLYYCTKHDVQFNMNGSFTTTDASVGSSSEPLTQRLEIMPNPSTKMTMIHFDLAAAAVAKITITSMDGKIMATPINKYLQAGGQVINYDCSGLAAGSYLVTLESNGTTISKRVVVEH
ncbi:MAG: T9SS type A sorting domain-containing protein [Bacteroidetes bacterium]|nr:T9SS type A sorting domain-containing protein [Bacteroidota bacterium]